MKKLQYVQIDGELYKIGDADIPLTNVEIDLIFSEVLSSGYGSGGYGGYGGSGSEEVHEVYSLDPGMITSDGIGDYEE
jgi:hypothetical protein